MSYLIYCEFKIVFLIGYADSQTPWCNVTAENPRTGIVILATTSRQVAMMSQTSYLLNAVIQTIFDSCICQMRKFYLRTTHQILERRTHSDFTKLNSLFGPDEKSQPLSSTLGQFGTQLHKPPRDGTLFKLTQKSTGDQCWRRQPVIY